MMRNKRKIMKSDQIKRPKKKKTSVVATGSCAATRVPGRKPSGSATRLPQENVSPNQLVHAGRAYSLGPGIGRKRVART